MTKKDVKLNPMVQIDDNNSSNILSSAKLASTEFNLKAARPPLPTAEEQHEIRLKQYLYRPVRGWTY
jgi:hypothetical protein